MKYLKKYSQFNQNRLIKEEFISKLFRDITGKNKKRIEAVFNLLEIEGRKNKLDRLIKNTMSFLDKKEVLSEFNQSWIKKLSNTGLPLYMEDVIKNIFTWDLSEINKKLEDKISQLDQSDWKKLESDLRSLKLEKTEDILENAEKKAQKDFAEKLENSNDENETNFKNHFQYLLDTDNNIRYWGGYLQSSECDIDKLQGSYSSIVAFVRSLCLRLKNSFFHINNYNDNSFLYDRKVDNYIEEYGSDWKDKFIPFLDEKVIELEVFKSIELSVNQIKDSLKKYTEIQQKQKKQSEIYNNSIPPDKDSSPSGSPEPIHINELPIENYVVLSKELKNWDTKDTVKSLSPSKIVKGFENIKFVLGEKKVGEFIEPIPKITITIVESDTKETTYNKEIGGYVCGNIYYSGSIHNDITMEEIPNYINKTGGKYIQNPDVSEQVALFCTTYPSGAAQYALHRTKKAENNVGHNKWFCPTVYKIKIKPGSIFYEGEDLTIDKKESFKLKKLGFSGVHSGNNKIGGGNTIEVSIVDPESILSIEKIPFEEIQKISESDWARGTNHDKKRILNELEMYIKQYLQRERSYF